MNAIIGLCHFCDSHGPRTLFCTQAFKYNDLKKQSSSTNSTATSSSSSSTSLSKNQLTSLSSIDILNRSESVIRQINAEPASSSDYVNLSLSPQQQTRSHNHQETINTTCKACRAFENSFHHYISYEKEKSVCYVSQSTPSDSEVFALVRKACLRTLHCEVFEDSIYFDDDKDGSVIGYEFNIKDSEGRGMQRSYSLIIIMKDRIYLQQLMSFLSKQMALIANNIKKEAEKKFEKDMKLLDHQINEQQLDTTNLTNIGPASSSSALLTASTSLTSSQRQTLYTKKLSKWSDKRIRGLIELTDDALIFGKLHMWFTWVLRMSHFQLVEEFMHAGLSEDLQVKFERDELNDEIYAETFTDPNNSSKCSNLLLQKKKSVDLNLSTKLLKLKCENSGSGSFEERVEDREQINDLMLKNFRIENLKQLLKFFGEEYFHQIAFHTIVGNQVIVRGKYENMVSSIIRTLEDLIPLGCCKSVYFSNKYLKSYECRLLGLSGEVKSPFNNDNHKMEEDNAKGSKNVFDYSFSPESNSASQTQTNVNFQSDLNDYLFVDIIIKPKDFLKSLPNSSTSTSRKNSINNNYLASSSASSLTNINQHDGSKSQNKSLSIDSNSLLNQINSNFNNSSTHFNYFYEKIDQENYFNIILKTNSTQQLNQAPKILTKIEAYLLDESLDIKSATYLIKLAKEEWLNKTKVLYKFNQSPRVKNSVELETLLKMLTLTKFDELAIKFWQAGLSDECKAQIRST